MNNRTVWELVQTMSQLLELKLLVLYFSMYCSLIWNSRIYASSKNTCTFKFLDKSNYFICHEKSVDAPSWTEQTHKTWRNITPMATSISKTVPKQQGLCLPPTLQKGRSPTAQLSIKGHLWALRFQFFIHTTNITASRLILYYVLTSATKLKRF